MEHKLFQHKDLYILRDNCFIVLFQFIALLVSACTSNRKEEEKLKTAEKKSSESK